MFGEEDLLEEMETTSKLNMNKKESSSMISDINKYKHCEEDAEKQKKIKDRDELLKKYGFEEKVFDELSIASISIELGWVHDYGWE